MSKQLFGTDGIRGEAGAYPLDSRTVFAVGGALAGRLGAGGVVLIGMDTRESGPEIAAALAGGLASGGVETRFAGVMPTAGVSYLTKREGCAAGAMISASHNSFTDNGIKLFGAEGFKLPDDEERALEAAIFRAIESGAAPRTRRLKVEVDFAGHYFDHLLAAGAPSGELRPLKLVVDCANGAAYQLAARLFAELGMDVDVFGDQPDGRNINLDCGSLHLDKLQARVTESGADLGVAFDGDADRSLFVADDGEIVDGDVILLLAAEHLKAAGRLTGDRVVATVMSNMGLEAALRDRGVTLDRTGVGDKYVLEKMVAEDAALGGEQSGHIILREHANTGDGLLTARLMLEILSKSEQPLSVLRRKMKVFPQRLHNVVVLNKPPIEQVPALKQAIGESEKELGANGRVLVRYSGTESLLRVMVEAAEGADVDRHVDRLVAAVERELGG